MTPFMAALAVGCVFLLAAMLLVLVFSLNDLDPYADADHKPFFDPDKTD